MEKSNTPAKKFSRRHPRPSFVEGMARIMDLGGSLNHYTADDFEQLYRELRARRQAMPTGPEADAQAIRNCWQTVGNHLREAMGQPPQTTTAPTMPHAADPANPSLPLPDDFQKYNDILPGASERILAMSENQRQHQIEQEKALANQEQYALETARTTHTAESARSKLGLIFAFIIALTGIGLGAALIFAGVGGFGLGFLFASLATLAGAFIYTDRTRRANRRRPPQNHETD